MMNADFFYETITGRRLLNLLQRTGAFRIISRTLRTGASRMLIPRYIRRNRIDMRPFEGQTYESFAAFFARKKPYIHYETDPNTLISPCDGRLSLYPITSDLTIPMKGSVYTINDLIPNQKTSAQFAGGCCMVFRLEASDYHRFCFFDDGCLIETNYVPGQLHSVQPIALHTVPVFRLNRRWWSVLETDHFGTVVQVEVGAMMVGGVSFTMDGGTFRRGEEMGNFELAGSTIILLLGPPVHNHLVLRSALVSTLESGKEVRVRTGMALGRLRYER
ncbi:MAG: phosphatidylserine decarboxylase [Firmicutes bacterium]|nr:phosphatidylserine decarboxylase [Bacillota bacterium]